MTIIYMFSYETMCMDLLDNDVENIEGAAEEILGKLRLGSIIEIGSTCVVGKVTACLLQEEYKIKCAEIYLI
ncbi:hypothetical protein [Clostridium estertheticum]|uniref:hypothetical protein n=1 Tax=Clostridium estertheticum TaxID=238834 RepID=UPI001C0C6C0F|nr:hypothetical protein [Clostridium estertheticum]MBU3186600.1 hypothetical protein [Clostridium estertheticum]